MVGDIGKFWVVFAGAIIVSDNTPGMSLERLAVAVDIEAAAGAVGIEIIWSGLVACFVWLVLKYLLRLTSATAAVC